MPRRRRRRRPHSVGSRRDCGRGAGRTDWPGCSRRTAARAHEASAGRELMLSGDSDCVMGIFCVYAEVPRLSRLARPCVDNNCVAKCGLKPPRPSTHATWLHGGHDSRHDRGGGSVGRARALCDSTFFATGTRSVHITNHGPRGSPTIDRVFCALLLLAGSMAGS